MKLTFIFIIGLLIQSQARISGQSITINAKNASFLNVIEDVKNQTGYYIFANKDILSNAVSVNVSVKNVSLNSFLKELMRQEPFDYFIEGRTIILTLKKKISINKLLDNRNPDSIFIASPKFPPIEGIVTDSLGTPMANVTVHVIGTNVTVVTNEKGRFQIIDTDPATTILEFSFIGYKNEIVKLEGKVTIHIILKVQIQDLQEMGVLTTGYQTIKKDKATGSFDQVDQKILSRRPVSNLSTALEGMVPGMQGKENADGSVSFLIRGNTSMYADRSPLVVIDGFPVGNSDFSTLNPNDVESVTVLKDAAASSIWGARSANGVIVITTKKAKKMNHLKIEANVFSRVSTSPKINQLLTTANPMDEVTVEKMAFQNNWYFGSSNFSGNFNTGLLQPLTLAQELMYSNKFGQISTDDMNKGLDSLSKVSNNRQISDLLLRRSSISQYNIAFSNATEKTKSIGSFMYEDNSTKYQRNGYKRYALNFNNEYIPTNFLKINIGLFLQYKNSDNSGATLSELSSLSPYETLLNPDGSYSVNLNGQNRSIVASLPMNLFPYSDWSYNLLREVRGRNFNTKDYNVRLQAGVNIKFFYGLNFDSKIQYERNSTKVNNYYSEDTYFVRNLANTFIEYNNSTRTVGKKFIPLGGIGQFNNTEVENYVFRNQLTFDRAFGNKHSINAIAGMEISQYHTDNETEPWLYGYYPDKLQSSVPQYGYGTSVAPLTHILGVSTTLSALYGASSGAGGNTVLNYELDRYLSYYSNLSYTYNQKYTITGSIRADASNFITKVPSLRWEPMWSVGALWNIKKEAFLDNLDKIDQLTIRMTYGRNGNVERSTSTNTLLTVGNSLDANTGTIIASIADNGNPMLRWEITKITNIGSDFSFFNNKLTGKVDYYRKNGIDITGLVALPAVDGTISQRFNNASLLNKGIEIVLGTNTVIPGINVSYMTSVNYAYNTNRITKLYNPSLLASAMVTTSTAFVEGKPVNPVFGYQYGGTINGVPQIIGPGGTPYTMNNSGAAILQGLSFLKYMGTTTPPQTLGWYNSFGFKGFQLSLLLIGKMGGVYRNTTFNYDNAYVGSSKIVLNRYVSDVLKGRTDIPPFPNPNETLFYNWTRYTNNLIGLVESSSYIEMKEVTLDYNLPLSMAKKIGLSSIKIFTQSRDLGLLWAKNKNKYNPDWLPGTDRPLMTFTLGANIVF